MRRYGLRKTHARKEEPKPEPTVTQEQLDELEPGDTVFHKAFGCGRIIDIDEACIDVTFDSDDKKKPSRKFLFPGSFVKENVTSCLLKIQRHILSTC